MNDGFGLGLGLLVTGFFGSGVIVFILHLPDSEFYPTIFPFTALMFIGAALLGTSIGLSKGSGSYLEDPICECGHRNYWHEWNRNQCSNSECICQHFKERKLTELGLEYMTFDQWWSSRSQSTSKEMQS